MYEATFKKDRAEPGTVVHTCNPGIKEAREAEASIV